MPGYEDHQARQKRGRRSYSGKPRRGNSDREFKRESRYGAGKRDLQMTDVTCASCGKETKVPFKPTSKKPVFCRDCFKNDDRSESPRAPTSSAPSNHDLDIINKKLNKIMEALDIN